MQYQSKTTLYIGGQVLERDARGAFVPDILEVENQVVNLYPDMRFQEILGFGGAFTEASGYVLSEMDERTRKEIVDAYFGPDGLRYNFCRGHIDSCDFSRGNYSAVTDADDADLSTFTLARDEQYILPFMRAAKAAAKQPIKLMLSPWSPPAFMKTNGRKNGGGKLKPEYRERWARYVCRYVWEYRALGLDVAAVSVQNEPKATQTWDSCVYTAGEEAAFARDFLAPALKESGLGDIEVFVWDHNKERAFERARDIFDACGAADSVDGVAVHWYSGDHFEAIGLIRRMYPDKKIIFTEGCVEYSKFGGASQLHNAQMYAHEMVGDFAAGLSAFIDWNMALDSAGGPNHVGNFCDAPVMCDIERGKVSYNLSMNYIGHFSRYVERGAHAIGFTRYTDALETAAFRNPDGSLVLVALNRTAETIPFNLRVDGQVAQLFADADSIMTTVVSE